MKTFAKLFVSTVLLISVYATYAQSNDSSNAAISDSTEYELIITEPDFESYLVTQPSINYYSKEYYKSWNQRYTMEWNSRYTNGPQQELYENYLDYSTFIDYGIELEYKLYHYFRFFEKKNKLILVYRGR